VQEVIDNGVHGLLADFYDVDGLAERAMQVLRDPGQYKHLGQAARQRVLERYDRVVCHNQLAQFFQSFYNRAMDNVFANLFPG
jgi:glycosyltransferase involved in cell wall biosynthesis